jgi:hypothetical protein
MGLFIRSPTGPLPIISFSGLEVVPRTGCDRGFRIHKQDNEVVGMTFQSRTKVPICLASAPRSDYPEGAGLHDLLKK